MDQLIGQTLGQYRIIEVVGEGGMAVVYRAYQPSLSRDVALKVLPAHGWDQRLDRLAHEAQTIGNLHHPNIVPVYDFGQDKGYVFIAMRYIPNANTLAHLIQRPLAPAKVVNLITQIADALDHAHQADIIHRDVKPGNILLDGEWALLSDFGLARTVELSSGFTVEGMVVGTPDYMSPEQGSQGVLDHRSDIYSLGIILFEILTGLIPHKADTPLSTLFNRVNHPLPPPRMVNPYISEAVERVLFKALATDPNDRFNKAGLLAQALAEAFEKKPFRAGFIQQPSAPARKVNPFFYGGAVPTDLFHGRHDLLQVITERIGGRSAQSVSIVGERRMGKTSLLTYLKTRANQLFPSDLKYIVIYLDLTRASFHTLTGLMRVLRRELTQAWREPWSKDEDNDLSALDFALDDLQAEGIRLILCLDEVEHLTQRATEFNDLLEDWRASGSMGQMAMVTASAQPLADLCSRGGLTSPFYNIFSQHWLGLFHKNDWQALVTTHMSTTAEDLAFIERVAGGQPFFTQMTANYLWLAHASDSVDYDLLYHELWTQAESHLRHLWSKLNPAEKTLLKHLTTNQNALPNADKRRLANLTRRGITRDGRPFSAMFSEMIAEIFEG